MDNDGLIEFKSDVHFLFLDTLIKHYFYRQNAVGVLNSRWGEAGVAGERNGWLEVHLVEVGDGRDYGEDEVARILLFVSVGLDKGYLCEFCLVGTDGVSL